MIAMVVLSIILLAVTVVHNTALRTALIVLAVAALLLAVLGGVHARDGGQWSDEPANTRAWYRNLMQPDNPVASCCGEADAYWADSFETDKDGNTIAVITDDRDDEPLQRPHIDPGTRVVVPSKKLKWDAGNPTGHGVLFMSKTFGNVYCYVTPGGV